MPRYEYECEKCGPFEVAQKIADAPLTAHECGAPAARRISRTSFALKGEGWYADGYGGGGAGGACAPSGCARPGCAAGEAS